MYNKYINYYNLIKLLDINSLNNIAQNDHC